MYKGYGLLALAAIGVVAEESVFGAERDYKQPNILICVADDAGHFSAYGNRWVKTPNFDSVASKGILFDNAYTCNSKSAPSRACMITGRNSWQLEEAANHWCKFPTKYKSFPEVLKEDGYKTGYTGKGWGPGIAENEEGSPRKLTGKQYNKIKCEPPTSQISPIDYSANFEQFLKERKNGEPFCFWYGAREPHRGYEFGSSVKAGKKIEDIDSVPSYFPDNDIVRTDMLDYALEIEYFDKHLGNILAQIDSIGELDNTLVIVTSDHGMPFPRVKGQDYLDSNHIPLAIMWGEKLKNPGRRYGDMVGVINFAPTVLMAAGVNGEEMGMETITGNSLMDIIEDKTDKSIDRSFMLMGKERHDVGRPDDEGYPIRALLSDNYLYIHNYEPERWPAGNPSTGYMNIDGSPTKTEIIKSRKNPDTKHYWDLSMGKRNEFELYNIAADPECLHNLAYDKGYEDLVGRMEKVMTDKLKEQNDPRMEGNGRIFDKYPNMCKSQQYYNRRKNGENPPTSWINDSDFDPEAEEM